jgi:hypothetical protein
MFLSGRHEDFIFCAIQSKFKAVGTLSVHVIEKMQQINQRILL